MPPNPDLQLLIDRVLARWRAENPCDCHCPAPWADAVVEMAVEYYARLETYGPVDHLEFEEDVFQAVRYYADPVFRNRPSKPPPSVA